jgi:hypothetical protein
MLDFGFIVTKETIICNAMRKFPDYIQSNSRFVLSGEVNSVL